jgi:hypothetical protein
MDDKKLKSPSHLYENIEKLSTEEISTRIKSGHYAEEAHEIAVQILKERKVEVPQILENYKTPSKPIYGRFQFWIVVAILGSAIGREIVKKLHGY